MFLLKTEHSYAVARFLLSVPVQAHAVLAVGGFQGDGVDLPAVVHRDPHRTAQTAVLGHYVGFPSPAFAGQNLAGEGDRAGAARADFVRLSPPPSAGTDGGGGGGGGGAAPGGENPPPPSPPVFSLVPPS